MKKRRVFDQAFRKMAIELSHAKRSVQEAACELGIDSSRITKWRQNHKSSGSAPTAGPSDEQKQIKRLQKELRNAQLECDTLKKAVSIVSRGDPTGGPGKSSDL